MSAVLPITIAAFAALCIWLTVRIINRRERWAKWALAGAIAMAVLYIPSFGPACWLARTGIVSHRFVWLAYRPILHVAYYGPPLWSWRARDYSAWWAGKSTFFKVYQFEIDDFESSEPVNPPAPNPAAPSESH